MHEPVLLQAKNIATFCVCVGVCVGVCVCVCVRERMKKEAKKREYLGQQHIKVQQPDREKECVREGENAKTRRGE